MSPPKTRFAREEVGASVLIFGSSVQPIHAPTFQQMLHLHNE